MGILKHRKFNRFPQVSLSHFIKHNQSSPPLVVELVIHHALGLLLLRAQEAANGLDNLRRDDQRRGQQRLAIRHQAVAADLLALAAVRLEDVVLAGQAGAVGQEDQVAGVGVDLAGGLLDDGELGVDLGEGGVAEGVGPGDVGRDVLVGLLEVGDDGLGEGLVGRVAELEGALAVGVGLERLDAVVDYWVAEEVLGILSDGVRVVIGR